MNMPYLSKCTMHLTKHESNDVKCAANITTSNVSVEHTNNINNDLQEVTMRKPNGGKF